MAILIVLSGGACASAPVVPSPPPTDWSAVQALPAGAPVRLTLQSGRSVVGQLSDCDEGHVTVQGRRDAFHRAPAPTTFAIGEIAHVFRRGSRQIARGARVGALVGLGAGVFTAATGQPIDGTWMALTTLWVGEFTAVGAAAGSSDRLQTLVWTSRPEAFRRRR